MKAMILAAGRGERMRPLSDHTPKPLLLAGGKPLIVWQIERLARAGFDDIVINHAHLGALLEVALGDGAQFAARIRYSPEPQALETMGGIAQALALLGPEPFVAVSADIYTEFDYRRLISRAEEIALRPEQVVAHFVLTDNPPFHPQGDMGLRDGRIVLDGPKFNYGNIAVFHPQLFSGIPPGTKRALFPAMYEQVRAGKVSGEHFHGRWFNIGTPHDLTALDQQLLMEQGLSPRAF
jgi:N-acetyl-alpha-D-muramate 1-phosphate uridylyltransferase